MDHNTNKPFPRARNTLQDVAGRSLIPSKQSNHTTFTSTVRTAVHYVLVHKLQRCLLNYSYNSHGALTFVQGLTRAFFPPFTALYSIFDIFLSSPPPPPFDKPQGHACFNARSVPGGVLGNRNHPISNTTTNHLPVDVVASESQTTQPYGRSLVTSERDDRVGPGRLVWTLRQLSSPSLTSSAAGSWAGTGWSWPAGPYTSKPHSRSASWSRSAWTSSPGK